jgi:hypothetical protein
MSAKIFVRERRKIEKGEKKPRFRVVGVSGGDLKLYVKHIRKKEPGSGFPDFIPGR